MPTHNANSQPNRRVFSLKERFISPRIRNSRQVQALPYNVRHISSVTFVFNLSL